MQEYLDIALLHLEIDHGQPIVNRERLVHFAEKAAQSGAELIVAPEMAISGYSFDSPEEIAPFAETVPGPTVNELRKVASHFKCYICFGLAEIDNIKRCFYNSAVVVGPEGKVICCYRKVNGETAWAERGDPTVQKAFFDTPWGRMAVLICSDTYYGIMCRVLAREGVHMLLVPANWPKDGMDPALIWRARAMEHSFWIAACNRTGRDRRMDARQASSYVFDTFGNALYTGRNPQSLYLKVPIPLKNRRLFIPEKVDKEEKYTQNIMNTLRTLSWERPENALLPKPGILCVHAIVTETIAQAIERLSDKHYTHAKDTSCLIMVSAVLKRFEDIKALRQFADARDAALCGRSEQGSWIVFPNCPIKHINARGFSFQSSMVDYGPARLGIISPELIFCPELTFWLSSQGVDILILFCRQLDERKRLLMSVKCTEHMAIATLADSSASLVLPPKGHGPWDETICHNQGLISLFLDTQATRDKDFLDRFKLNILFNSENT